MVTKPCLRAKSHPGMQNFSISPILPHTPDRKWQPLKLGPKGMVYCERRLANQYQKLEKMLMAELNICPGFSSVTKLVNPSHALPLTKHCCHQLVPSNSIVCSPLLLVPFLTLASDPPCRTPRGFWNPEPGLQQWDRDKVGGRTSYVDFIFKTSTTKCHWSRT